MDDLLGRISRPLPSQSMPAADMLRHNFAKNFPDF
jgi:hypothetical protein